MNTNQIKIKIQELESNLENETVKAVLKHNNFDLDRLENSLKDYAKYIGTIIDEDLLKTIDTKINELISHSNQSNFHIYSHQFINAANFLISNTPQELNVEENDIPESQISEEEFSKRYDKLIEALNFEGQESNLTLETPSDKVPIKLFKNNNNSIVVEKRSGTNYSTTKNKLINRVYRKEGDLSNVYDTVVIQKLLDNSIFDFLLKDNSNDLMETIKNKLSNNENELLKLSSKLEGIERLNQELSTIKESLSDTLKQSTSAEKEFKDARDAAVNYAKLNASVSYWETKQKSHKTKFRWFGGGAIVLIVFLVGILFWTLNVHNEQINENNKTKITNDINTTNQTKEIISDNEEKSKIFDFDYSKLAWYILMIFASSSAFWIIRITVKIALSNLHLSEDAHERVVMIQTYLSFVKEGQIEEKDKSLILSSLFRPSNIGIITDESSVTVADIITAFKK